MIRGHPRSTATFDRTHTTSYSNLTETMELSCTVFEILSIIFQKLKRSRDNDHAPFRDNLSSIGWDLLWSTCTPYFEVSILSRSRYIFGGLKFKMWHLTWPRPFQGQFVICRLGLAMINMINMHTKCEVSSLSCSRDILRGLKVLNGLPGMATPMSETFCHP